MTNEFWSRWKQEFLQNLQLRQKWVHPQRNLQVNDVVISKEDSGVRNRWPLPELLTFIQVKMAKFENVKFFWVIKL